MLMPAEDIGRWLGLYGWVGAIILVALLFSHITALDRWFQGYIGLGAFLSVMLSIAVTGVVHDPVAGSLTHAAIMYAMVIIYAICGLRFSVALLAGWCGGLAGELLSGSMGGSIDWAVLHRTYTGASLLGMFLAYVAEVRDRELFLHTRLLALSNARTAAYARQVDQLAREDPLTGLANRRHFNEIFVGEWRRAQRYGMPVSLLLIDVDHFKHYNDVLGHPAGDRCLVRIAAIIAAHARRSGDLAVRFGGEEFVLLVPDANEADAAQQAEQLVADVRAAAIPHAPGLEQAYVTVSVGAAVVMPGGDYRPEDLLEAADQALYRVKRSSRNGWQLICLVPPAGGPGIHIVGGTGQHLHASGRPARG
jgi:diguanylate cyclase (GGDEF)-like protein